MPIFIFPQQEIVLGSMEKLQNKSKLKAWGKRKREQNTIEGETVECKRLNTFITSDNKDITLGMKIFFVMNKNQYTKDANRSSIN